MGYAAAKKPVESTLLSFLVAQGQRADATLLVAYSGGPDSTALLAAASAIGAEKLKALYVDHGIRPQDERSAELDTVRRAAASLRASLIVARVRPGAVERRARSEGIGIEAAARRFRHRIFRSVIDRLGTDRIYLAHTADDQIETLLMRILGGADAAGLRGMKSVSGSLYRPLLDLTKSTLLSYVRGLGLAFSQDSTNSADDFLRNRIRNRLVPLLDEAFPGWRKGLSTTAAKSRLAEAAIASAAARIAFLQTGEGYLAAPADDFLAAPEAVRIRAFLDAAGKLLGRERLSHRLAIAAISAVSLRNDTRYRGGGIELRRDGSRLLLDRGLDFPRRGGYFVVIDRPCRVRIGRFAVRAFWEEGSASGIRADAFRFPLVLRSRRNGDAIDLPGGTKRIDELLSEWGILLEQRYSVPIVEDRNGIVAVLGAGFGVRDRYRRGPVQSEESRTRLVIVVKGA